MKKIITFIIISLVGLFGLNARYTIHNITGNVGLERGGKSSTLGKGMEVKPNDYVVISKGGKVEIYNDVDKRIYTSIKPGKISVTRLIIEAKGASSDNAAAVTARMNFGKKGQGKDKVFKEKGMVRRHLEETGGELTDSISSDLALNPSACCAPCCKCSNDSVKCNCPEPEAKDSIPTITTFSE